MSSLQELQALLAEERHLREEEKRRREIADERAENEQRRREAAELLTSKTSFADFIRLCHQNFTLPLHVELDRRLTTKGPLTSANDRKHPTYLRPWEEFPQAQLHCFDAAYRLLNDAADVGYFSPRLVLEADGQAACARALTSKKDLEHYDRVAVGQEVEAVLRQLMSMPQAQELMNQCRDVEFHNHLNALARNVPAARQWTNGPGQRWTRHVSTAT